MAMKNQQVDEANKRVSIFMVCALVGVEVSEGREGSSIKTYCPFGRFYHSDGGKEPAFRVYGETNSAYCFSCKKYYSPVSLYSSATDLSSRNAAEFLLEKIGYKKPTPEELWSSAQPVEPEPDKSLLNKALRTYCERVCVGEGRDWHKDQFEPTISIILEKCLNLLDSVATSEDADFWMSGSKEIMSRVLRRST